MSNMDEIESLRNFIESNAFDSMSATTQTEMKLRLQQLQEEKACKNKEKLISDITSAVTPVLLETDIPVSLIVTYDKDNGVVVKELTVDTNAEPEDSPVEVVEEDANESSEISQTTVTRTKKKSEGFSVTFPDGTIILCKKAIMTMFDSIKKIGLDIVAEKCQDITFSGYPLVCKKKRLDGGREWQTLVDDWYIYHYISNDTKIRILHQISDRLNLGLVIRTVVGDDIAPTPRTRLHTTEESTRDTSKYSLNGGQPVSKRRLAWQIVKEYIKKYPDADYTRLKEVFVPEITTKTLGVVRSILDMPESMPESEYSRRYMMKDEDLIELADGDIITVCSQWNVQRIERIIDIANAEGWNVKRENDEISGIEPSNTYNSQEEEPAMVAEPEYIPEAVDAHESEDVLESSFGVTFADGTYIEGENSFDTFLQTLRKIGLSRIPEVDITYGNINLVSAIEKDASKQMAVDGVYVYKELTDDQMMDALQQISDYYYMDLEIGTEE